MSQPPEPCRVCGARREVLESGAPCSVCGFVYLGSNGRSFDYEHEYDEKSSYNSLAPEAVLDHYRRAPNTGWALRRLKDLQRDGATSLFEFGASQGAFMALARELGFVVKGVELASSSIRYGRDKLGLGAALEQGIWRARRTNEDPVDAVCAFEVLEHSEDPIEFLTMARSWLKPRGTLLVSVPNGLRLSVRVGKREVQDQPPHHLMYWTPESLRRAVERVGMEPAEVATSDLTQSDLLNLVAPRLAARRAVDLGSFRPVGAEASRSGLPGPARLVFPLLTMVGRTVARSLNVVPHLGQRLMVRAIA
jgi:2-polyprenyl-3-methyl-5-hydroxy-6-metoxy-1,4-benzoquinol methylase